MRKAQIVLTVLGGMGVLLLFATYLGAHGTGTGIATPGSPHNFADNVQSEPPDPNDPNAPAPVVEIGAGGWNQREEICRVCHVPHDHNRDTRYGDVGLLWNHALSSATYTMYSSVTGTLDGAQDSQPTGVAKLCLGCHDGTVGIDTFDKFAGGTVFIGNYADGYQIPGAIMMNSLQNTHPISIVYDETADTNLHPKTNSMGGSGTIEDVLENGTKVQCHSCHDVHDQAGEAVPDTHLLRVAQTAAQGGAASGLCLTCHKK